MKKEKAVITRLDGYLYNEIDRFSEKINWSKSKLFRAALIEYLFINGTPVKCTIVGTAEFSFMIDAMTESQINELAEISYKRVMKFMNYFLLAFTDMDKADDDSLTVNAILIFLLKYMFSLEGQKFFNQIKKIKNKNQITIFGEHDHSKKFSLYVKFFLLKFLKKYQIRVIKEEIEDNKFMLEFITNNKKEIKK